MMRFSIDIEKFYQELLAQGKTLKGVFSFQYPIYCIHSSILDSSVDPLGSLDFVIAKFLDSKPNLTSFQIGSIMGISKLLVEIRLAQLVDDELLERKKNEYYLTRKGENVFINKSQERRNIKSYDFFVDGVNFNPLPRPFYNHYRSKLINEDDSYFYTNSLGKLQLVRPFAPDIVHNPLNKDAVVEKLLKIDLSERVNYSIPEGLVEINEISFSKMTFPILISVSSTPEGIEKETVDAYGLFSLKRGLSYYECVKENVQIFQENLVPRINNLQFKMHVLRKPFDEIEKPKPKIVSNWPQIDKTENGPNSCFAFSEEDFKLLIESLFEIKEVDAKALTNSHNSVKVDISRTILKGTKKKEKLIEALIRGRDYQFGSREQNVFICFFDFFTSDEFVQDAIHLKQMIKSEKKEKLNLEWAENKKELFKNNLRDLLINMGELDVLEQLDMEKYMN